MMSRVVSCLAVGLIAIAAGDCPKEPPEAFAISYIRALTNMAEEAAKQCDSLLDGPNCYWQIGVPGDPDNDPRKAISLPDHLLGDSPELRRLRVQCYAPLGHQRKQVHCDGQSVERTRIDSSLCSPFKVVSPEAPDWRDKGYEAISLPENPKCKVPWVQISVVRKSPKGNELHLDAHFLPKKWLDKHPEANEKIARPLVGPSVDEPAGAERREEKLTPDAGSGLDSEREPVPGRGILRNETPAVDGEIDPRLISKAVWSSMGKLKACYEAALDRNLPQKSRVQIHWKVTTKGKAANVEIEEENVGDVKLLRCLRREISQTQFPAEKRGSTEVVYPFIFDVGDSPRRKTSDGP
jgi:hypothetical protein